MTQTLDAKWRGTMTITPATASPGQRIALRFAKDYQRGVAFTLAVRNGKGWEVRYYLTSGREFGSPTPDWWSVEDSEDRAWRAIGIVGCGPDFVIVPNTATSGTYCLCTLARDEAGALLTIGK